MIEDNGGDLPEKNGNCGLEQLVDNAAHHFGCTAAGLRPLDISAQLGSSSVVFMH